MMLVSCCAAASLPLIQANPSVEPDLWLVVTSPTPFQLDSSMLSSLEALDTDIHLSAPLLVIESLGECAPHLCADAFVMVFQDPPFNITDSSLPLLIITPNETLDLNFIGNVPVVYIAPEHAQELSSLLSHSPVRMAFGNPLRIVAQFGGVWAVVDGSVVWNVTYSQSPSISPSLSMSMTPSPSPSPSCESFFATMIIMQ
jgi:hypothetical protein